MSRTYRAAGLAALIVLLCAGPATAQVSKDGMGKVLPVELFACKYNEGQGPADLDKVIARWTKFADDNGIDDYAAWTLTPHFYGPEQDFDVIWMGAFADGNAMGRGMTRWLAQGRDLQAAFDKVVNCDAHIMLSSAMYKSPPGNETPQSALITMMDCELNKGYRYTDIKAAELKWSAYLQSNNSNAGYWHWFPVFGGGDSEFDYKVVHAYTDYTQLGADFELVANGGGRDVSREIFADIDDCDDARVYIATSRRSAQIR